MLVTTVVAVTVFAELSTTNPIAQEAPVTPKEILTTCGSCHEVPPPDILPRSAWRGSFERMAMIRSGERQMAEVRTPSIALPDDMQRVLRHYERIAPAQLSPPEFARRTLSMGSPRHATLDVGVMSPDSSVGTWVQVWENKGKRTLRGQ
jgi:hypothetical protein